METMNTTSSKGKVSFLSKLAYGFGDVGCNFSWSFVVSFLMIFYTDVFGVSMAAVATLMLVSRIWDAVNDPVIGSLSDRTKSRWGRYRPWLLFGAPITGLVFKWTGNKGWAASVFSVLMGISMVVLYFFSPNEDPVLFYTFAALAQFFFSGFTLCVSPDNALDTVLLEIPSSLAISIIVVCFIWFVVLSYAYN